MRTWIFLSALLTACGGYTDAGSGTGTLKVEADLVYRAGVPNVIDVHIDISHNGVALSGAVVTVADGDTSELFQIAESNTAGRYTADVTGYHRKLALKVEANEGNLTARLEGPGPHVIIEPVNGDFFGRSGSGDFKIKWSTTDGVRADEVIIEIDPEIGGVTRRAEVGQDDGHFDDISRAGLDVGAYELDVLRRNRTVLEGGVAGSTFSLGYVATNEFVIR